MAENTRRFPSSSDALTQATLNGNTLLPCRYKAGTLDDSDKSITFSLMQSSPVAKCESNANAQNKIATVSNFPDFSLENGREVMVYFHNGNSALNPTLNVNNTGTFEIVVETVDDSVSIPSELWKEGSFCRFKYVSVTIGTTTIQKWVLGASTSSIYNALSEFSGVTSLTQAEYNALSEEKKMADKMYLITDADADFFATVDKVESGNMNAVTSNAVNGALTNVTKYESFTVTSATGAYTVTSQYCYKEGNHIHIEAFGKTTQLITNASTQPLIVIPNNFAPITTERKNIGTVIINNNSIYPSVAFAEVYNTLHCITQAVTDSIDNNTRVSFIIDYNINL